MQSIDKLYSNGVYANKNVNFTLCEGEIHALVGENGAGKSTLMKILFGLEQPSDGKIFVNESEVTLDSPKDAMHIGIGMVHQHFKLIPSLTVAENLVLGHEPINGMFLDKEEAIRVCREISQKYDLPVNPIEKVKNISIGEKQKLEILKALYRGAKVLIMDEPTAVLAPQEITELFIQLKKLKDLGHTIIFISHRLDEIRALCDRLTILKDGTSIGVYNVDSLSNQEISNLMVGREVQLKVTKLDNGFGKVVASVRNLTLLNEHDREVVKNISFDVREGQILGIAALEGNGQKELIEAITKNYNLDHGEIRITDINIEDETYIKLRNEIMGYIPEDRIDVGTAQNSSIYDNLIGLEYRKTKKRFLLNHSSLTEYAQNLSKEYAVKTNSLDTNISMLSGGNMQKVVVAREISRDLDFIIAQQPTRGVDVGSIEFIHDILIKNRDNGVAVLLVSSDLNEVINLSDSLIVMYEGSISAYFPTTKQLTEETVGKYMLGVEKQSEDEVRRAIYEYKAN